MHIIAPLWPRLAQSGKTNDLLRDGVCVTNFATGTDVASERYFCLGRSFPPHVAVPEDAMTTTVTGFFDSHADASAAVRDMQRAGVRPDDISIVMNDVGEASAPRAGNIVVTISELGTSEAATDARVDNDPAPVLDDQILSGRALVSVRVPPEDVAIIQGIMTKYNERGPLSFSQGSKQGESDKDGGTKNNDDFGHRGQTEANSIRQ